MPGGVLAHSNLLLQAVQHLQMDSVIQAQLVGGGGVWPRLIEDPNEDIDVTLKPFIRVHEPPMTLNRGAFDVSMLMEFHFMPEQGVGRVRKMVERAEWLFDMAEWAAPSKSARRPMSSRVVSIVGPTGDPRWTTRKIIMLITLRAI